MKKTPFSTRVSNFAMNQLNKTRITKKLLFKTRCILGYEFFCKNQTKIPKKVFGSAYGGHCVALDKLNNKSTIYSVGLGYDITFDEEMIKEYGMHIHGFDPTPKSIEFLESSKLPEQFTLHTFGISNLDGTQVFHPPNNPEHISHSTEKRKESSKQSIEVEMKTLSSTMKQLGHDSIDLIKMDIEGSEYAVLDEICLNNIKVGQILVEYHHHFSEIQVRKTKNSVKKLNEAGYRIFHVSENGHEVSFIHSSL
tara:strand:- start:738 stop:1493 length:756 start_codon:yes stop_codon:yes gene_type:complete